MHRYGSSRNGGDTGAAPYDVSLSFDSGATIQFTGELNQDDGSAWPIDDYDHEWAVWDDGGCKVYTATPDNGGIIFSPDDPQPQRDYVTFMVTPNTSLCNGKYRHAYRMHHQTTGEYFIPFDGELVIVGPGF